MKFVHLSVFCLQLMQIMCTVSGKSAVDNGCREDTTGVPVCSQLCTDNAGQYTCTCVTGYVLADDNRTCVVTGEEPLLVLVSGKEVSVYYTEAEDHGMLTQLPHSQVTAIGFGPGNSVLIAANNGKVVYRMELDGRNNHREPEALIDTGLKYVTSVAVDWVTSNVYMVDSEAGTIIVCTGKGDNCAVLISDLHQPYSVLVNVKSRKLLWSEWGSKDEAGSIHYAYLDGSQRSIFVDNLDRPQNLVLDETSGALYWIARSYSVYILQYIKLKNGHKKINAGDFITIMSITMVATLQFLQLYGIGSGFTAPSLSVLADHLYVTTTNSTVVMNKFTGDVEKTLGTGNVDVAAIYHSVLYNIPPQETSCNTSPCSHLCVPSNSNHGYRCLCPVDMELITEQNCSRKQNEEMLLVSGLTGIYEVPTKFIGNHGFRGHRLLNADVNCVVYDGMKGRVFYYDDTQKAIQMLLLHQPQLPSLLYNKVFQVEGMAHDTSSQVLYWTTTKGRVYTGREDGSFSAEIISDLRRPRGITVDPETGYLYICDWGSDPQIVRCYMDGTHCDTFIHVPGGHPNMVVIATPLTMETGSQNRRTLYWTDSKLEMLNYVNLTEEAVIWEKIKLNHSLNPHPVGLVVTDSTIYFSDWNTQNVHYMEKSDVATVMDIHLNMGTLYGIDHTLKSLHVVQTVCSVDNGGCTHLCLAKPAGERTCVCPDSERNVSCIVEEKKLSPQSGQENLLNKQKLEKIPVSVETKESILLIVLPITGVVILLLAVSIIVFCYHKYKQRKQNWMFKFVHYMKAKQTEDSEGLVSDSTMSVADPNFKQFDDIDYPEDQYCLRNCGGRNDFRETSMISTDSAFTEMKDFETYSSIDNL